MSEMNERIIQLEEDLYESKTIQLDLLENLKQTEDQLQGLEGQYEDKLEFARQKI
jgi:hypothetical protein